MQVKKIILLGTLGWMLSLSLAAQVQSTSQFHPYMDDKPLQMGGFIGAYFPAYIVTPINVTQRDARSYTIGYGLTLGGYFDFKIARHLNLRTAPGLSFGVREIQFINPDATTQSILSIPISIPLYLKWSAEREANYRPYVMGGVGADIDIYSLFNKDTRLQIKNLPFDFFVELGIGCDFYSEMPKALSLELKYRLGTINVLQEKNTGGWKPDDPQYTDALASLRNQAILLIFYF